MIQLFLAKKFTDYLMAFVKRWSLMFTNYWKMVGNDYLVVFRDLLKDARKRPVITMIKLLPLSGVFYACKTNPTEEYVCHKSFQSLVLCMSFS